jgi:predicted site-specific integrase-resolvase
VTAIQLEDLPVTTKHLNQIELSRRWSISPRTLERWRWLGLGPRYLKIVGRVVYRLEDIEAFEAERARDGKVVSASISANKHAQLRASTQQ